MYSKQNSEQSNTSLIRLIIHLSMPLGMNLMLVVLLTVCQPSDVTVNVVCDVRKGNY